MIPSRHASGLERSVSCNLAHRAGSKDLDGGFEEVIKTGRDQSSGFPSALRQTLAVVSGGVAAWLARSTFAHFMPDLAERGGDPYEVRLVVAVVYFGVILAIDGKAFKPDPALAAFEGFDDPPSRRWAIREYFHEMVRMPILLSFIFYMELGAVTALGWGVIVFIDVLCLLVVFSLLAEPRAEYHAPRKTKLDWLDKMGAFWLVACAFGPFFGWVATELCPITPSSWYWVYGLRTFLAAGLPVILGLPLLRYAHGKAGRLVVPLLLLVTSLPVSTAVWVFQDLLEGPRVRQVTVESATRSEIYLAHTGRSLGLASPRRL